jgi:pyruvate kinase
MKSKSKASHASKTIAHLITTVGNCHREALGMEKRFARDLLRVDRGYRASARNLLHYLALRGRDIRSMQTQLTTLGLSSLGRSEAHTLATLNAVWSALRRLARPTVGRAVEPPAMTKPPVTFLSGPLRLERHTRRLLGPRPPHRATHIMVTMPSEAAGDAKLVEGLLRAGMDIMRINGAHDDAAAWRAMVGHLRRARRATGRRCRILVDLAGPKLRTGAIAAEPGLLKLKPDRDHRGQVIAPARVWLSPAGGPPPPAAEHYPVLPVTGEIYGATSRVVIHDLRGKKRRLKVESADGGALLCATDRTIYVETNARLIFFAKKNELGRGRVGAIAATPQDLHLRRGDRLVLTRSATPGRPARSHGGPGGPEPARIPCTLPQVFRDVRAREPIWFDDGKIGGVVVSNAGGEIAVRITHAPAKGARLLSDKGINLPLTDLRLSGLTKKDQTDLTFARRYADLVGLSFAQRSADIQKLAELLKVGRGRKRPPGIILKIETRRGFAALPQLLLTALRTPPVGVMVARGDLAVEVGFERLAEVQEEILWLCEAAHVPAIWATQVLEGLAKKGVPSRAEVTDAATAVRAECVMLNKGPHVTDAVVFLDDVLRRMQAHQKKKSDLMRRLSVAGDHDGSDRPVSSRRMPISQSGRRSRRG